MTHPGTQWLPKPIHRRRVCNLTGHGLPRRPAHPQWPRPLGSGCLSRSRRHGGEGAQATFASSTVRVCPALKLTERIRHRYCAATPV